MIPLFKPSCTDAEVEAVSRVLRSGWWGMGAEVEAFEEEFAAYTGAQYAVAVNSATSALELAARATGQVNGVVVVPALTFVSTGQAMQHAGNGVRFADVDEETLCIDWDDVQYKLSQVITVRGHGLPDHPVAVVPVWYGGTVQQLYSGSEAHSLGDTDARIIEDCAHAAGSTGAGQLGIAACWSFHAVKNLATGDGGMVTTNSRRVRDRLKSLRWCGIDKSTWERDQGKYGWDYDIPADGEKMHMNDITAALGRVQLRRLDQMNRRRRQIARSYSVHLSDLEWLKTPPLSGSSAQHLYVVRVAAQRRNRFIDHMLANGVSAGVHYKPLTHYPHLFPGTHRVPVTERVWQTMVTLPLYPDMTEGEQEQVIEAVRSFKA